MWFVVESMPIDSTDTERAMLAEFGTSGIVKRENQKDYTVRMREWFDHYLMDKPAAKWMEDGIPLLKMKEDLEHEDEDAGELGQLTLSASEPAARTLPGCSRHARRWACRSDPRRTTTR